MLAAVVRRILPAALVLRWLCRIDNVLYALTSRAAVWYGGGLHPKHHLTGYHDFFVDRVTAADRVLDVGCGIGVLAAEMAARKGASVTGVDLDAGAIAQARARHREPGLTFVVGDARRLPAGSFTVVVLSNVLEHLDARVDFLRDTLAATGATRLLVRVPLFERDWRVPLKRELHVDYRLDPTHRIEYTLAEFGSEIAAAGLVLDECLVRWGEIWAACRPRA